MAASVELSPLVDPTLDRVGFPLDHPYLERVYCSVLGPTSVLLLRRVGELLAEHPHGVTVDLGDLSRSLGVGFRTDRPDMGRNAPLRRSMERITQFRLAAWVGEDHLGVHTKVPALSRHRAARLSEPIQVIHHRLLTDHLGGLVAVAEGRDGPGASLRTADAPPPSPVREQPPGADIAARLRAFGTNGHDARSIAP